MKNLIKQSIPRPIKSIMQKIYYLPADTTDVLLGRRDELTPPRGINFAGAGDFKEIGEEFLRHFIELGELKPDGRVLDVGCGIGRMAVPLTKYLKEAGGLYEGFDIVTDGVNWCRKEITPRYPNFHFQLADIYNKEYNPKGKYAASEYKFPYGTGSFDFVFLTSVFTHMLTQDMENYFSEIARVLKKGGRCLATLFLLNVESLKLIDAKLSTIEFKYGAEEYRTISKSNLEHTISYDEKFVKTLYEKYGLNIIEPLHYGSWCGRKDFLNYQDLIIAAKT